MGSSLSAKFKDAVPLEVITNKPTKDGEKLFFEVSEQAGELLNAPDVEGLPVAVISIAGAKKTGKSFILSFLLRYAAIKYLDDDISNDWLGDENLQVGVFEFKEKLANTSGIVMWPFVFKTTRKDGTDICFFLIDTQGTNDDATTSTMWSSVFSLSVLLSSVQIYTIDEEITEEDLQSLEAYVGFMRLFPTYFASENRPGQNLLFLISDFKLGDEYECGYVGGDRYLQDMVFGGDVHPMHQEVRERITNAFDSVGCCTLPYAGRKVIESKQSFIGTSADIEDKFKKAAAAFVEHILDRENLIPKRVGGKVVTCGELFDHLDKLVFDFNLQNQPIIISPLPAQRDSDHRAARDHAVKFYVSTMEQLGCSRRFKELVWLELTHLEIKDRAVKLYMDRPKVGEGGTATENYLKELIEIIDKKYGEYKTQSEVRHYFMYSELPIWSTLSLCTLVLLDDFIRSPTTVLMRLMLMARMFFWLCKYYPRRIFGED